MPSAMILAAAGFETAVIADMFFTRLAINFAVSMVVSRVFAAQPGMSQTTDSGVRQQVPPANTNSIPMIYGKAFTGGIFVDAVLSTDQTTMYYVMAISHKSPNSSVDFNFGGSPSPVIWYGDQYATFDLTDTSKVTSLRDNSGNEVSTISGNLNIWLYKSSEAGVITPFNGESGANMPHQVMGDTDIDAALRWPSSNRQMNGLVFAIIKLKYNRDADTTRLAPITFFVNQQITPSSGSETGRAGDVWYDYMTNFKYGAAMEASIVDTVSRDALNVYSDEYITYIDTIGSLSSQRRYRHNGVIDTAKDCLSNIDQLMLACDSWNQYNATTGKWSIVINKAETTAFAFNDTNIIGDIQVSAQDITTNINQIEAQFPDYNNKDQQNLVYIQTPSNLMYVNEPANKYTIKYEMVNNSVQAQYLANRQLEQAREDLIVSIKTPYPGIQVDAGDVVSITNAFYGWDAKLFRVMKVTEASLPDGSLGAALEMTEYNAQVYDNFSITEYTPAPNSGLSSPNYFTNLVAPTIGTVYLNVTVPNFEVNVLIPATGRVTGLTLFYRATGTTDWKTWITQVTASTAPYTPSSTFTFKDVVLPTGNYDFAFNVFNDVGGSAISPTLSNYSWTPYPAKIGTNLYSQSNQVQTSYDVNNQYGGTPLANYIGNWQQTVVDGVGLNLTSPAGDSLPLRLYVGTAGEPQYSKYPHMTMIPLTAGLPTSSINGSITFMSGHIYTYDGNSWNAVFQEGDVITPSFSAQSANTVFAGPISGAAATPAFRSLVAADVPTLNQNTTGYASYLDNGSSYYLQAFTPSSPLFLAGWEIVAPAATNTALRFTNVTNGALGSIVADASNFYFYDASVGYTAITARRATFNINTGTPPFVISSTTRVSNLNVATAGTADALLNGNRQIVIGTAGNYEAWKLFSASSFSSGITLLDKDGTYRAAVFGDGTDIGFVNSSYQFEFRKQINGQATFRIGGVEYQVLNAQNVGSYALPITGGSLTVSQYAYGSYTDPSSSLKLRNSAGTAISSIFLTTNGGIGFSKYADGIGWVDQVEIGGPTNVLNVTGNAGVSNNFTVGNTLTLSGTLLFNTASSPYTNTIQFGDNTGWQFRFMTSVSGTPTTRFTFGDNGNFTAVGTVSGTGFVSSSKQILPGSTSLGYQAWKFLSTSSAASQIILANSSGTFKGGIYADGTSTGFTNSSDALDLYKVVNGELVLTVSSVDRIALHSGNYQGYSTFTGTVYSSDLAASSWGFIAATTGYSNNSGIWFSSNVGELLLRKADGSLSTRIAADGSYAYINNNNILTSGNSTSYNSAGVSNTGNNPILFSPSGGSYVTNVSSVSGAIKIRIPAAVLGSNAMMTFTVQVYQYSTGQSFSLRVGGYNYSDSGKTWYNEFAYVLSQQNAFGSGGINVRFGWDGTSQCIWIGELGSSWSYPQVFVTDWQAGYASQTSSFWMSGWSVSFETSSFYSVSKIQNIHSQFTHAGGIINGIVRINNLLQVGQNTNGTAYIDAYGGYAWFGRDSNSSGIRIDSSGNVLATASLAAGLGLGVQQTDGSGNGLSLYGGASPGQPTYGIMFAGQGYYGGYGAVNSDWATYFTMNGSAGRGWIFRDVNNGNRASISNTGILVIAGGVGTGGATPGGFFGSANATKFYNGGGNSEVLIQAGSGAAILEFDASGNQAWHVQNSGGVLYFTQTSVADRMYISGGTVVVPGTLSKGSGTFDIPHPSVEGKRLRHSFVEGPRVDLIYRGHVTLINGTATLNMDTDAVSEGGQTMTEGTFVALTRDADIFVQNLTGWEPLKATIDGAILTIICKDQTSSDTVSWMVVAERKDDHLHDADIVMTDDQGRMILEYVGEPLKKSEHI